MQYFQFVSSMHMSKEDDGRFIKTKKTHQISVYDQHDNALVYDDHVLMSRN